MVNQLSALEASAGLMLRKSLPTLPQRPLLITRPGSPVAGPTRSLAKEGDVGAVGELRWCEAEGFRGLSLAFFLVIHNSRPRRVTQNGLMHVSLSALLLFPLSLICFGYGYTLVLLRYFPGSLPLCLSSTMLFSFTFESWQCTIQTVHYIFSYLLSPHGEEGKCVRGA